MFKDIYKAANDDIKASDELLEAVLSTKRRRRRVPPVLKYSSAAAACAAIAVCLAVSPSVVERDDSGVIYEETASPTATPAAENGSFTIACSSDAPAQTASAADSAAKERTAVKSEEKSEPIKEIKAADVKTEAQTEAVTEMSSIKAGEDMSDIAQKKVNTNIRTVVLHVNSYDYGGDNMDGGEYDDYAVGSAYETVEWTMDDYFEYLGENVMEKLSLPPDFTYIGDTEMTVSVDENGVPSQDSRIFPYEGDNGRYVSVITSKDTLTSRSYLEDERYVKSDIEGNDAVVIGGGEEYKSYMISNDVSHIITSDGVTEDELADMLVSIGG